MLQLGDHKAFQKLISKCNIRSKTQLSEFDLISLLILLLVDLVSLFEISGQGADHVRTSKKE